MGFDMKSALFPVVAVAFLAQGAIAQEVNAERVQALAGEIGQWMSDPAVLDAVKAQNAKHATLSAEEIESLDQQWRAETTAADAPLITSVMTNDLSGYLSGLKEAGAGMYTEIFVMDSKGLNVGQSDVTSDYWQGDEAKFIETFPVGPDAVHVSDVEFDESSQTFQVQVSVPVVDAGAPIGAVTVGLNADALQ